MCRTPTSSSPWWATRWTWLRRRGRCQRQTLAHTQVGGAGPAAGAIQPLRRRLVWFGGGRLYRRALWQRSRGTRCCCCCWLDGCPAARLLLGRGSRAACAPVPDPPPRPPLPACPPAAETGLLFFEASAKTNVNVVELFDEVADK